MAQEIARTLQSDSLLVFPVTVLALLWPFCRVRFFVRVVLGTDGQGPSTGNNDHSPSPPMVLEKNALGERFHAAYLSNYHLPSFLEEFKSPAPKIIS